MAKTKIAIKPDGSVKFLNTCGVGTNCLEATREKEKEFGEALESTRQLTDEYYEGNTCQLEQENENG